MNNTNVIDMNAVYPMTIGKRVEVDTANKVIEIEVKDTCAGLTILPMFEGDFVNIDLFVANSNVRVEMIRKNQPDVVLYDLPTKSLVTVMNGLNKVGRGVTIPFALNDNLILGKDSYLKVFIEYARVSGGGINFDIDGLRHFKNYLTTSTNVPLSVKVVEITEDVEIDTEYFQYLMVSSSIYKMETVVNTTKTSLVSSSDVAKQAIVQNSLSKAGGIVADDSVKTNTGNCCCNGSVERTKVEMTFDYLAYLSGNHIVSQFGLGVLQTTLNQKVKLYIREENEDEVFLVQA